MRTVLSVNTLHRWHDPRHLVDDIRSVVPTGVNAEINTIEPDFQTGPEHEPWQHQRRSNQAFITIQSSLPEIAMTTKCQMRTMVPVKLTAGYPTSTGKVTNARGVGIEQPAGSWGGCGEKCRWGRLDTENPERPSLLESQLWLHLMAKAHGRLVSVPSAQYFTSCVSLQPSRFISCFSPRAVWVLFELFCSTDCLHVFLLQVFEDVLSVRVVLSCDQPSVRQRYNLILGLASI